MAGEVSEGHPLTIMFTDIEGSTALRTRLGDRTSEELLRLHDRLLRERVEAHEGRVVDATGDGFMVTFGSVRKSIACAIDIQRILERHGSFGAHENRLRVRIGINTGEVIYEDDRVRGEAVHAAARVMGKAAGGQILVSEVVKQLAGTVPEVAFQERGRVRLKGFADRWRLFELVWRSERPSGTQATQDIVGRVSELAELEALLTERSRWPIAAFVEGEAGIGKTSVFDWGLSCAESRGYRVLSCRPAEAETKLSYAALGDLLATVGETELADLVEVQRRALQVALLRADAQGTADPRAISTGLISVLTRLGEKGPVVVAVDDVQWLDAASARALEFAFRRLPASIALILARRTERQGPVNHGLDRSLPDERVVRIDLKPLSLGTVHEVVKQKLEISLARPTLVRLHEASGGNPFYVLEIAREMSRRGGESAIGERLPLPARLEELLVARIEELSPAAREVVLVASALSRPAVSPIEEALDGRSVGSALIEAEEAGLVTVEGGRIRFTHPLLASTAYSSASGERRRRLHGRLAAIALEQEERARHLALSVTAPDDAAAAVLETAAHDADRRGAQDAAAELFSQARRLTSVEHTQDVTRRTLGQASALFAAGDVSRSRALAEASAETAAAGPVRAEALFLLGRISAVDQTSGVAIEYLERAAVDAGDDRRLRGRIHAQMAWSYWGDPARGVEHAEEAMRLLDAEDEPGLMAFALFQKFFFDAQLGRGADAALLEQGLELDAKSESRFGALTDLPLNWFKGMDEFDSARARYRVQSEWARARGAEASAAAMLGHLAEVELRAGNWPLAQQFIEESCSVVEQLGARGPLTMPLRTRAMIDAHVGRIDRARATLAEIIEENKRSGNLWWEAHCLSTLGFVELTAGNAASAATTFTQMTEHLDQIGIVDMFGQRSEPDYIEALVALGEIDRARLVLARLGERGKRLPRLWISTTLPRSRALVLAADGDVPAALAAVADAIEHRSSGELPFELGRTLLLKGQLHRRAKQKRAAKDTLSQALEIFDRLGAPLWGDRARGEMNRVGLRPSAPLELTPTERRIAELAATGLTNREVAEAAFMSPKTVEANLSRVYRKLGIRSRAELGARMAERADSATP